MRPIIPAWTTVTMSCGDGEYYLILVTRWTSFWLRLWSIVRYPVAAIRAIAAIRARRAP